MFEYKNSEYYYATVHFGWLVVLRCHNACGAKYGARAAYQLGESHDSISHGDDAGFTWTSIIAPCLLSGLVFEIVAVWTVLLLYYTGSLPALIPTLKRRPSPLFPPQVQWTQGAFFRGSQDPRGSWRPWLVGWGFPPRQDWTGKWQKVLHTRHAPRKNWAATPGTAVRILAASIIPVDRCSKPSSGMRILLLDLMILGLFMDSGELASSFPSLDSYTKTARYQVPGARNANNGCSSRPDYCDGGFDQFCDSKRHYSNISLILVDSGRKDLLEYMDVYWKDFRGDDLDLWAHEWNKHGKHQVYIRDSGYADHVL